MAGASPLRDDATAATGLEGAGVAGRGSPRGASTNARWASIWAGAAVPLFLRRVGVDPAVSSAVVVTTFTDVFGFLLFLGLASAALSLIV